MDNYPWTRHFQRYEYVVKQQWNRGKRVIDVGGGQGVGSAMLGTGAKSVLAMDPAFKNVFYKLYAQGQQHIISAGFPTDYYAVQYPGYTGYEMSITDENLETYTQKNTTTFDLATVIEVIEHIPDPERFMSLLAGIAPELYITTPLVEVTGPTRNTFHVQEFSAYDFDTLVGRYYTICKKVYQLGNLQIVDTATPVGDSMNYGHVDQMIYARRK